MIGMKALRNWAWAKIVFEKPDFVIGDPGRPYLRRWWVIPRNPLFNIYLHQILRSDDGRALHDHPWWNVSFILSGGYFEHSIDAGGIHRRRWRGSGAIKFRRARAAHRLELAEGVKCLSLFITGPHLRQWGFHCPEAGWRHWRDFTDGPDGGLIGKGCGD